MAQVDFSNIITSADSARKKLQGPRLVWVAALVAVIIGAGIFSVSWFTHKPAELIPKPDKNAPTDFMRMTADQIRSKLYYDTGLDSRKLVKQKITDRSFKSFSQAYEAAQALRGLKDYARSQSAFKAAADKADKTTKYTFYEEYNAVADLNKDKTLSKQLADKTRQAIQNDSSLSAPRKKALIDDITMKEKLKELAG